MNCGINRFHASHTYTDYGNTERHTEKLIEQGGRLTDKLQWDKYPLYEFDCPGKSGTPGQNALANFLGTDVKINSLRGHANDNLIWAAFEEFNGVDGVIDREVNRWIKEHVRDAYKERLHSHVRNAKRLDATP